MYWILIVYKRSDYLDTSKYSDFCQNRNDINTEIISVANNYNIITLSPNDLIIEYVRENPNNKSARHLNKKFGLKLKQVYYNELLKGL